MSSNGVERVELKVAGLGGQGVLLAAQLLARTGVKSYPYVTWFPSYGVRMRGGESTGTVIISKQRIHAPMLSRPRSMIIMHNSALDRFESTVAPRGLIVLDSSLVDRPPAREDVTVVRVPASQAAMDLGSAQLSNLVLLGAFLAADRTIPLDDVVVTVEEMLRESGKERLIASNRQALLSGYAAASNSRP